MYRPERTCIGCRGRSTKSKLIRLVWDVTTGQVVADPAQSAPGRGCYLHHDPECHQLAIRRRAFGRALRVPAADGAQLQAMLAEVESSAPDGARA